MFAELHQFHFLRPQLLWLILPAAGLCWALARTVLNSGQLQKIIDAELLPHLILRGGARRPWLFGLIFALLTAMILALAGPTWRKLPTPVYSNQDALVILLDLSPSMMATDLSPNRLTRARLKILDILKKRKDGLTALVAYAGESHVVTPLTEDTATIANLVPALSPKIMPVPGSNIEMAVQTAIKLLKDGANGRGQILAVTDGIDKAALDTVADELASAHVKLSILAVGTGEGSPIPRGNGGGFVTDRNGAIIIANYNARQLRRLAHHSGGHFARISVDDSDLNRLLPEDNSPQKAQLTERKFDQWREAGPLLVLLLLPLAALLFRRGALASALPLSISLATLLLLPPQRAEAFEFKDLWQRQDQQAEAMLKQGEAKQAAKTFRRPDWRGTANYRAGDYDAAAKDFSGREDAQDLYNLGNSLTHQRRYDEAIKAYDQALKKQPQLADATHNRDIARKLKALQQKQQQQQQKNQQKQQNQKQQQKQQQQSGGGKQQNQQNQQGQQQQQNGGQQNQSQGDQQRQQQSGQKQQPGNKEKGQDKKSEQQQSASESEKNGQKGKKGKQQAGARESKLDPETQQALDQWLRQVPDDPAGLMREKFKYQSLQRRRAYRAGEWQPPENGATQRW
ncbi:VWA domain-containing protein [Microbulbifer sp. SAOS-129_SWC]|uniref:VWA domain-containing protein n=1 Tax=Microbulbifer sp. SAOS-129_SWC TaxID=3145235 RepID=UPI0032177B62